MNRRIQLSLGILVKDDGLHSCFFGDRIPVVSGTPAYQRGSQAFGRESPLRHDVPAHATRTPSLTTER